MVTLIYSCRNGNKYVIRYFLVVKVYTLTVFSHNHAACKHLIHTLASCPADILFHRQQ